MAPFVSSDCKCTQKYFFAKFLRGIFVYLNAIKILCTLIAIQLPNGTEKEKLLHHADLL